MCERVCECVCEGTGTRYANFLRLENLLKGERRWGAWVSQLASFQLKILVQVMSLGSWDQTPN